MPVPLSSSLASIVSLAFMGQLSTPDHDGECSGPPPALHIPTEVCENIIDMLYSVNALDTLKDIPTLHSCALVCRSWRVRSQRVLFYKIQLSDRTSLHRLSAILDDAQHLREYVHEVDLTGYHLHNTTSIFALFPAAFARKLPKLERLYVGHLLDDAATWHPKPPDPPKAKSLPYIPLHPYFPSILSSFTAISRLLLQNVTFRSFGEFARMLHGLPNLEDVSCYSVRWINPGGAHPGAATFMPWATGKQILPPFAPKLQMLRLYDIAADGAETLISTRGPHLTWLEMTIPVWDDPEPEPKHARGGVVDLGPCTGLKRLDLIITPQFSTHTHAFVAALLASWTPRRSEPHLTLCAYRGWEFTRQGFADALRGLGNITEAWLRTVEGPFPTDGSGSNHVHRGAKRRLSVYVFDWEAQRQWWSDHLCSCFPTWLRLGRLDWTFGTPPDKQYEWAADEKSSLPDVISPSKVEEIDSESSTPVCESKDAPSDPASKPA